MLFTVRNSNKTVKVSLKTMGLYIKISLIGFGSNSCTTILLY